MSWVRAVSTLSNWVCMISFMFGVLLGCVFLLGCGMIVSKVHAA